MEENQMNNFNQQQFQGVSMQQFQNQGNTYSLLPNNMKTLPRVFKIALIASIIALIGTIISLVLVVIAFSLGYNLRAPEEYKVSLLGVLIYAVLGVVIAGIFVPLTLTLKKMKSKGPAIVMIVFASIFIFIWGIGLMVFPMIAHDIHANIAISYLVARQPSLGTILLISNCSIIPGIISISGWITLLIAGIKGANVNPQELYENRMGY